VGISSPNFYSRRESRDELWSTNKKSYCAHTDTPEVLVRCKLKQVHTPRGSRIQFWSRLLALLREEFTISKLTLHSDLGRRAASRRALPCPSSFCLSFCLSVTLLLGQLYTVTSRITWAWLWENPWQWSKYVNRMRCNTSQWVSRKHGSRPQFPARSIIPYDIIRN